MTEPINIIATEYDIAVRMARRVCERVPEFGPSRIGTTDFLALVHAIVIRNAIRDGQ